MLHVLTITFPFFALVLCGYGATRARVLPLSAIAGLNSFVLYFALPAMLYRFGAGLPIAQLLDPVVAGVYLLVGLALAAAVVLATLPRWGFNDAAFGALVTVFPNSGFMGVPLLAALLGAQSTAPVIVSMVVDMLVMSSLGIALSRLGDSNSQGGGSGNAWRALRLALRGVLVNPLPWAIVLGALASATGWRLPAPGEKTVAMLADAASPVALFTIGAVLARAQINQAEQVAARHYVPLALVKLLVHPVLMWMACQAALYMGMQLSNLNITALLLTAALPSASNVSLLAERFGAHGGRIARIILVSTVLAFVTFSAAVAWLT